MCDHNPQAMGASLDVMGNIFAGNENALMMTGCMQESWLPRGGKVDKAYVGNEDPRFIIVDNRHNVSWS